MTGGDHHTHFVIQAPGPHADDKSDTESCTLQKIRISPEASRSIAEVLIRCFKPAISFDNLLDFLIDEIIIAILSALQTITHLASGNYSKSKQLIQKKVRDSYLRFD